MARGSALPLASERGGVLDLVEGEEFDVVVIGGGITGAGVARELARRKVRVLLLEANDFASGTSSRSTKLIHGGLRYLAMGKVGLVRKTAAERKIIHRMAKHLAEPRWMVYPTTSRREQALVRLGVMLYEAFGGVGRRDRHQRWNRFSLKAQEPLLDQGGFRSAVVFREYLTDDARLVLANLRDAAAYGAVALNHCRVTGISAHENANGDANVVVATCEITKRNITIGAKVIVNASGPWVDPVRRFEGATEDRLVLSKGVHLTLPSERLPVRNMVTMPMPDGRKLFAVPRGEVTYVGTTDTLVDGTPEVWPQITRDDISYILQAIEQSFDIESIEPKEVLSAWAGLRPLIAGRKDDPSEISRKDEVWVGERNMITIAGGKLTGYRLMAEKVADTIRAHTSVTLAPAPREGKPFLGGNSKGGIDDKAGGGLAHKVAHLPGGDFEGEVGDLARRIADGHGLSYSTALRLASLYGSEYGKVLKLGGQPIAEGSNVMNGEIAWAIEQEGAATLEDVFYRRTRAAWFEPNALELLHPMASLMAPRLGWTPERISQEIADTTAIFQSEMSFQSARSMHN